MTAPMPYCLPHGHCRVCLSGSACWVGQSSVFREGCISRPVFVQPWVPLVLWLHGRHGPYRQGGGNRRPAGEEQLRAGRRGAVVRIWRTGSSEAEVVEQALDGPGRDHRTQTWGSEFSRGRTSPPQRGQRVTSTLQTCLQQLRPGFTKGLARQGRRWRWAQQRIGQLERSLAPHAARTTWGSEISRRLQRPR